MYQTWNAWHDGLECHLNYKAKGAFELLVTYLEHTVSLCSLTLIYKCVTPCYYAREFNFMLPPLSLPVLNQVLSVMLIAGTYATLHPILHKQHLCQ